MEVSGKRANLKSKQCEICRKSTSDGFCNECEEYMCQKCFQDHVKAKPCRHHVLGTRSQLAKKDFKEILIGVQKLNDNNIEHKKRVQYNIKENNKLFDRALNEIHKLRTDINNYLDKAETEIIAAANKCFSQNEKLFLELERKTEAVDNEIDGIREQLNMRSDEFLSMKEFRSRVSNVGNTIAAIQKDNKLQTYHFKPEQKLKDLLTSKANLGTVQSDDRKEEKDIPPESKTTVLNPKSKPIDMPRPKTATQITCPTGTVD